MEKRTKDKIYDNVDGLVTERLLHHISNVAYVKIHMNVWVQIRDKICDNTERIIIEQTFNQNLLQVKENFKK